MKINDPSNYTNGKYNNGTPGEFWNYGKEIWCNM